MSIFPNTINLSIFRHFLQFSPATAVAVSESQADRVQRSRPSARARPNVRVVPKRFVRTVEPKVALVGAIEEFPAVAAVHDMHPSELPRVDGTVTIRPVSPKSSLRAHALHHFRPGRDDRRRLGRGHVLRGSALRRRGRHDDRGGGPARPATKASMKRTGLFAPTQSSTASGRSSNCERSSPEMCPISDHTKLARSR